MCFAEKHCTIINSRVIHKDFINLCIDCLSCRCCIPCRHLCNKVYIIVDKCLSGQCELSAVSFKLSCRQLNILIRIMLKFSVFRYSYKFPYRTCKILKCSLLCDSVKCNRNLLMSLYVCLIDRIIKHCREC